LKRSTWSLRSTGCEKNDSKLSLPHSNVCGHCLPAHDHRDGHVEGEQELARRAITAVHDHHLAVQQARPFLKLVATPELRSWFARTVIVSPLHTTPPYVVVDLFQGEPLSWHDTIVAPASRNLDEGAGVGCTVVVGGIKLSTAIQGSARPASGW
jgi:hypothetical protein